MDYRVCSQFTDARAKQFLQRAFDSGQVNRWAMNNNSHAFHPRRGEREETNLIPVPGTAHAG